MIHTIYGQIKLNTLELSEKRVILPFEIDGCQWPMSGAKNRLSGHAEDFPSNERQGRIVALGYLADRIAE